MKIITLAALFALSLLSFSCGNSSSNEQPAEETATNTEDSTAATTAAIEQEPILKRGQNIPFEKTITDGGISFYVSSPNVPAPNTMVIYSTGMETRNDTFQIEVEGLVHQAEIADINNDGYPEAYVFTQQKDNKQMGKVYVFTSYRNKSFGSAYFKELPQASTLAPASVSADFFSLEAGKLVRKTAETQQGNSTQAQQENQIIYELVRGEASYQLVPLEPSAQ
jgi:hypothetical protein